MIALSRKADEAEIPTFVMLRRLLLVAWIGSHIEADLAKSLGLPYTDGTLPTLRGLSAEVRLIPQAWFSASRLSGRIWPPSTMIVCPVT